MTALFIQLTFFGGCYLVSTLLSLVLGGFLALYRAAVTDDISAHGKITWVLVMTIFPLAALFFFLSRERNQKILILGTLLSLTAYGVSGYLLYDIPWTKHYTNYTELMSSFNLARLADADLPIDKNDIGEKRPDPLTTYRTKRTSALLPTQVRNNDDVSQRAAQLSSDLLIIYNSTKNSQEKDVFNNLDITLSNIRWEYIYDQMPSEVANQLLDDLQTAITNKSFTPQSIKAWQDKVRAAVDENEITNLFKGPETGNTFSNVEPPIPEGDPSNLEYFKHLEALLLAQKYDELEAIAETYRSQDLHAIGGGTLLNSYYFALGTIKDDCHCKHYETPIESEVKGEALQNWLKAYPQSITARSALATYEIANAWKERGHGYSHDVPGERWKKYELHLSRAQDYLKDLDPQKDSQIYLIYFYLAADSPNARRQLDKLYSVVKKNFPKRYDAYALYANYIQPKWFGSRAQLAAFVQKLEIELGPVDGAIAYTFVADYLAPQYPVQDVYAKTGLEWDFIKLAYKICLDRYKLTHEQWNTYLYYALAAGDKEEAQKAISNIHDDWDRTLWPDKLRRATLVAWAFDEEKESKQ